MNSARPEYDPSRGVFQDVLAQATRTPNAPALIGGQGVLSYGDVVEAADQIAAVLIARGVRPGDLVGLFARRSVDAAVATLGIARAGAVYVPLDPTHAPDQLGLVAEDLALKTVLVTPEYVALADSTLPGSATRLALDVCLTTPAPKPATWPHRKGDDPLYVMYTSGTTGRPKGVVVPHRGVSGVALGQDLMDWKPGDVVMAASTIACDGGTFDLWPPLMNGAAVVIVETEKPALDELARVIRRHGVTVTFVYTGVHQLLVDHDVSLFKTVRLAMTGGDVMSADHARRLKTAYPEIRLLNLYGPTEATCCSVGLEVTDAYLTGAPIPIGTPLKHDDAFLVDEDLVPLDAASDTGQLVLAGSGIALGYHGLPDKTAASFVPDPRPDHEGTVPRHLSGHYSNGQPKT